MGFWSRLFGRPEFDTTVTDYVQSRPAAEQLRSADAPTGPFRLPIQDVFSITGRGTVVTGTVDTGRISVGDRIGIRHADGSRTEVTVGGLEAFRATLQSAGPGDHIGVLLEPLARDDVSMGDILET
jgi:elongation factor Tu